MTDSDDERIAYLAGDGAESLPASERASLDELRALLSSPELWEEPDPALEDRVVAAIEQEAAARPRPAAAARPRPAAAARRRPAAPAPAPRAVAPEPGPAVPEPGRQAFRLRDLFRRPVYGVAAAAAVVAVAVVIGVSVSSSGPSPLQFGMVVSGTPLAPGAHGSATATKSNSGWQIKLSATGLPHLENGRYYQAWLENAAGILVPVGTFNDARTVTLWSGVPVTQYRTLTVTQQRAGAGPASSGRRVLIGTIKTR